MKPHRIGILVVHGIQGNPRQFDFLIKRLPLDICCQNLLLPGHGATTKEFKKAAKEQWLDAVKNASTQLRAKCDRIVFVGHSMGCLLGLQAQQELKLYSAMLLLCCPFTLRPTWRYFKNSISANLTKGKTDDPFIKAAWDANGVSAKHSLSYFFCAHPYLELFRIIKSVKNQRLIVPKETLFCFSELDEIVSKQSLLYAREALGAKTELLKGCGHNYFTPAAQSRLVNTVQNIIKSNESP